MGVVEEERERQLHLKDIFIIADLRLDKKRCGSF